MDPDNCTNGMLDFYKLSFACVPNLDIITPMSRLMPRLMLHVGIATAARLFACNALDKDLMGMQAGALEVFAMLLSSLSYPQPSFLLSLCNDGDNGGESESAVIEEIWSAALEILSHVVVHSPEGLRRIAQVPY